MSGEQVSEYLINPNLKDADGYYWTRINDEQARGLRLGDAHVVEWADNDMIYPATLMEMKFNGTYYSLHWDVDWRKGTRIKR